MSCCTAFSVKRGGRLTTGLRGCASVRGLPGWSHADRHQSERLAGRRASRGARACRPAAGQRDQRSRAASPPRQHRADFHRRPEHRGAVAGPAASRPDPAAGGVANQRRCQACDRRPAIGCRRKSGIVGLRQRGRGPRYRDARARRRRQHRRPDHVGDCGPDDSADPTGGARGGNRGAERGDPADQSRATCLPISALPPGWTTCRSRSSRPSPRC